MKKLLISGFCIALFHIAQAQMVTIDDTLMVIQNAKAKNDQVSFTIEQLQTATTLVHAGTDFTVKSFEIAFSSGGSLFMYNSSTNRLPKGFVDKIASLKPARIYIDLIKLEGLGKSLTTAFVVNLTYP